MTPDERRTQVRRLADELWNQGNVDYADQVYASNCSFHDPNFPVASGAGGIKAQVTQLRDAHPDLHIDVHDVLVDGDSTAARWTMGGTATGSFRGLPATGKSWVMSGILIDKWEGDRIVEEWVNYDLLGVLQQTGIIPEMAEPGATG